MPLLTLPPTIRIARPDEVPNTDDLLHRIRESEKAKIIEGFTFKPHDVSLNTFQFYSEINIDNNKLWSLFKALLLTFPDEISFIFGHAGGEEVHYSGYMDKFSVLNKIEEFQAELTQDAFFEFGIIFEDKNSLREVFVSKAKYLQYWGMNNDSFLDTMENSSIKQINDLNFIDEFPMARTILTLYDPSARTTGNVIDFFRKMTHY